jgi:hypothetical protein
MKSKRSRIGEKELFQVATIFFYCAIILSTIWAVSILLE